MYLTHRYRLKDSSTRNELLRQAMAVNFVWNFCCDAQRHAMKWNLRWPSKFDLMKLTSGSSGELGIHSYTIEAVCERFTRARRSIRRTPRYRGAKALPWIPVRKFVGAIRIDEGAAIFRKKRYPLWLSRPITEKTAEASFACDARGRWYLNVQCQVEAYESCGAGIIGVDLGIKALATLSDGTVIDNPRHFARLEGRLAAAQRARKRRQAATISAKIANARWHHLHIASTRIIRDNKKIVVGNIKSANLRKTTMAKAVADTGWYAFKTMLRYKALASGAEYLEVSERLSTQTCSACGARSGPKGQKGLKVREWTCVECGSVHDRDHNAAKNILGSERRSPDGEALAA